MNKRLLCTLMLVMAVAGTNGVVSAFDSSDTVYADEIDPTMTNTTTTTTTTTSDGSATSTTSTTSDEVVPLLSDESTTTTENTTDSSTDANATDVVDSQQINGSTTVPDYLAAPESLTTDPSTVSSTSDSATTDYSTGDEHVLDNTPRTADSFIDPRYALCGGLFLFGISMILFSKRKEKGGQSHPEKTNQ